MLVPAHSEKIHNTTHAQPTNTTVKIKCTNKLNQTNQTNDRNIDTVDTIDAIDTVDKRMLEYLKRVNLGKVCNPLLHLGNAQINTNTVGLP